MHDGIRYSTNSGGRSAVTGSRRARTSRRLGGLFCAIGAMIAAASTGSGPALAASSPGSNAPITGMAATADGKGYWDAASDGGIFAFGDAGFYGSMGGKALNAPVTGITATPDGKGYWEAASDGGIFAFGDAGFYGSMGGKALNAGVAGIAAAPDGKGYWEAASDGGVFAFGNAGYLGSAHYTGPAKSAPNSAAFYASQILSNPRITMTYSPTIRTDLQDAAAGRAGTAGAPLSATLLSLVAELGQHHSVALTALESNGTGHAAGSYHYSGDAVDIGSLDGVTVTGRNAPSITIIKELEGLLPPGSAFGQSECGSTPPLPTGVSTFQDTCNHLHIQVPRGTP